MTITIRLIVHRHKNYFLSGSLFNIDLEDASGRIQALLFDE